MDFKAGNNSDNNGHPVGPIRRPAHARAAVPGPLASDYKTRWRAVRRHADLQSPAAAPLASSTPISGSSDPAMHFERGSDVPENRRPAPPVRSDVHSTSSLPPLSRDQVDWLLDQNPPCYFEDGTIVVVGQPSSAGTYPDQEAYNSCLPNPENNNEIGPLPFTVDHPDDNSGSSPRVRTAVRRTDGFYDSYHPERPQSGGPPIVRPVVCAMVTYLIPVSPSEAPYTTKYDNRRKCWIPYPLAQSNPSGTANDNHNPHEASPASPFFSQGQSDTEPDSDLPTTE